MQIKAELTGNLWKVVVKEGQQVAADETLMILESMKMELSITAPHDGVVDGVTLKPGDRVALKQPLLAVHASADGSEAAS